MFFDKKIRGKKNINFENIKLETYELKSQQIVLKLTIGYYYLFIYFCAKGYTTSTFSF